MVRGKRNCESFDGGNKKPFMKTEKWFELLVKRIIEMSKLDIEIKRSELENNPTKILEHLPTFKNI